MRSPDQNEREEMHALAKEYAQGFAENHNLTWEWLVRPGQPNIYEVFLSDGKRTSSMGYDAREDQMSPDNRANTIDVRLKYAFEDLVKQ